MHRTMGLRRRASQQRGIRTWLEMVFEYDTTFPSLENAAASWAVKRRAVYGDEKTPCGMLSTATKCSVSPTARRRYGAAFVRSVADNETLKAFMMPRNMLRTSSVSLTMKYHHHAVLK